MEGAAKIGALAIEMERERRAVMMWMSMQGQLGNYRTNDQAPHWSAYQAAHKAFYSALAELGI